MYIYTDTIGLFDDGSRGRGGVGSDLVPNIYIYVYTYIYICIHIHTCIYTQIPLDLLVVAVGGVAVLGAILYLRSKAKS